MENLKSSGHCTPTTPVLTSLLGFVGLVWSGCGFRSVRAMAVVFGWGLFGLGRGGGESLWALRRLELAFADF